MEVFGETYEDEIKRVVGERGDNETLDMAALIDLIFDRWEDLFPERRGREGVKSAHVGVQFRHGSDSEEVRV